MCGARLRAMASGKKNGSAKAAVKETPEERALRVEAESTVASPQKLQAGELADRLKDPAFRSRVEDAIANLPPEKAAELVTLLEASIRRRKVELIGYLAAAGVLLVGMVLALYAYGAAEEGRFVGWLFLIPLALAGVVMIVVGRLAKRAEDADRKARGR